MVLSAVPQRGIEGLRCRAEGNMHVAPERIDPEGVPARGMRTRCFCVDQIRDNRSVSHELRRLRCGQPPLDLLWGRIIANRLVGLWIIHVIDTNPTRMHHRPRDRCAFVIFQIQFDGDRVGMAQSRVIIGFSRLDEISGEDVSEVERAGGVGRLIIYAGKHLITEPRFGPGNLFGIEHGRRDPIVVRVGVHGDSQAVLTQVVGAVNPLRLVFGTAQGREQHTRQDGDDGNDYQ